MRAHCIQSILILTNFRTGFGFYCSSSWPLFICLPLIVVMMYMNFPFLPFLNQNVLVFATVSLVFDVVEDKLQHSYVKRQT